MHRSAPWLLCLIMLAPATLWAEEVESPTYQSWARHKPGTMIRLRSVTEANASSVETITTVKLLEVTPRAAVVEQTIRSNATGQLVESPPETVSHRRMFPLLPGVKREQIGKPTGVLAQGEESVTIAGKTYKAVWYDSKSQTEAGPAQTRTWMSDEVPGKVLRSVTRVAAAGKTVTLELIEFQTP